MSNKSQNYEGFDVRVPDIADGILPVGFFSTVFNSNPDLPVYSAALNHAYERILAAEEGFEFGNKVDTPRDELGGLSIRQIIANEQMRGAHGSKILSSMLEDKNNLLMLMKIDGNTPEIIGSLAYQVRRPFEVDRGNKGYEPFQIPMSFDINDPNCEIVHMFAAHTQEEYKGRGVAKLLHRALFEHSLRDFETNVVRVGKSFHGQDERTPEQERLRAVLGGLERDLGETIEVDWGTHFVQLNGNKGDYLQK